MLKVDRKQITAGFIPHDLWVNCSWLLPKRGSWYYAMSRISSDQRNPFFTESVDELIRPLVRWLWKNGARTGPSCSGHPWSLEDCIKHWRRLKQDEKIVQSEGLSLEDIETGTKVLFQDPKYRFNMNFEQFKSKTMEHHPIGFLPWKGGYIKPLDVGIVKIEHLKDDVYAIRTQVPKAEVWELAFALLRANFRNC